MEPRCGNRVCSVNAGTGTAARVVRDLAWVTTCSHRPAPGGAGPQHARTQENPHAAPEQVPACLGWGDTRCDASTSPWMCGPISQTKLAPFIVSSLIHQLHCCRTRVVDFAGKALALSPHAKQQVCLCAGASGGAPVMFTMYGCECMPSTSARSSSLPHLCAGGIGRQGVIR